MDLTTSTKCHSDLVNVQKWWDCRKCLIYFFVWPIDFSYNMLRMENMYQFFEVNMLMCMFPSYCFSRRLIEGFWEPGSSLMYFPKSVEIQVTNMIVDHLDFHMTKLHSSSDLCSLCSWLIIIWLKSYESRVTHSVKEAHHIQGRLWEVLYCTW